jgi:hypothetical protein
VGGIYLSADGGQTWSLDLDSNGHEMDACDWRLVGAGYRVWCAGFGAGGSAVYTVQGASTPTFLPAAGTYLGVQTVSLSSATANATVYYTTDGSIPSTASAVYSSPIAVSSTATVEAMATAPGAAPSLVASGLFTITPAQLQFTGNSPSLTVTAGQSATAQLSIEANANVANVTFSCAGLPAGADCVFSPSPLSVTANPITVTVTFATSASAAHLHPLASSSALALVFPGLLLLPCGVFCTRRRVSLLPAGMLLALVAAVVGCGGSSGGGPQPPVQATVTVTASAPGAANATTQIPVTINPAG